MAQRSFSNERYRKDAKIGSTRKSAAKAKPVRKQGTVEVASKTKEKAKPKRDPNVDFTGMPTSPQIKMWRRVWWVLLIGGLAVVLAAMFIPEIRGNRTIQMAAPIVALTASGLALGIDLFVIRKLRNKLVAELAATKGKKSKKHNKETE